MRSALLLIFALSSTAIAQKPAPPPTANPPAAAPKSDLLAEADEITRQVVALRGLAQTRPFAKGVLSREQIGAKLQARIAKEYQPDEIAVEARVLKRLGLLPKDADYQKLVLDLLMEQVAGFYDPFTRELYIADWLASDVQRPALAHEIDHALQDMHFDLKKFATPIKDDGDRQLAHQAVVEGDGTLLMLEFVAQAMRIDLGKLSDTAGHLIESLSAQLATAAQAPKLAQAPRFLRETLLFPYIAGMKLVLELRRAGGWARVDEAFRAPPESTEQVLHPKKFLEKEHPLVVASAPLPMLPKEVRRDVLGELEWKVILAAHLDDGIATRAAAGWGGDRAVAYGEEGQPIALVSLSAWDSSDDALEMETALRKWVAHAVAQPEPAADAPAVWTSGAAKGEAWSVERRGRVVLSLFGVPAAQRDAVAAEVWKSWRVEGKAAEELKDEPKATDDAPTEKPVKRKGKKKEQ